MIRTREDYFNYKLDQSCRVILFISIFLLSVGSSTFWLTYLPVFSIVHLHLSTKLNQHQPPMMCSVCGQWSVNQFARDT